jgi:Asp/Glu/hydantoin racemase
MHTTAIALQRVEASGAEVAVIASNSPHNRFEAIVSGVQIPVIDIFEVAAQECARIGAREAFILGTELTMNSSRLREKFGQHGIRAQAPMEDAALAFTGESNLVRKATGYDQKKLKPRYPASGSRAARAERPADTRAYQ